MIAANDARYKSAAELADLKLEGLPTTKRGINLLAQRDGWRFEERSGRGGGRVYLVADLPEAARECLTRQIWDRIHSGAPRVPMGRPAGTFFDHHPDVAAAVEAIVADQKFAAPRIHELLAGDFERLPSLRSLQRYLAWLECEKPALISAVRNPDEYKNVYKIALGRSDADCTYAHEAWELDTTKADVITIGGRMMILGIIDRWSRRARFLVVPSESAQSVRSLIVDTIRAWRVMPTRVITDNGSGFINASVKSALETLGIGHQICLPGTPEDKPHIERLFGTFNRERAEILAGYTGHNVADAQQLRARAKKKTGRALVLPHITNEQLQQILDAWTDGVYHLRRHSTLRMSPMQKWHSTPVHAAAAPDENVLRLAMSALVGVRKIGKRGVVWQGGRYWSAACAPYMGREVIVRRDENELGQLFLFDLDNNYIDTVSDPTRLGLSQAEAARLATQQQNAFMNTAKAELREKQRRYNFGRMRDELLRRDAENAGKLVHLPPVTQERVTLAMQSMAGDFVPHPDNHGQNTVQNAGQYFAPNANHSGRTSEQSVEQKIERADRILRTLETGGPAADAIPETDRIFAHAYAASSEYRAQKLIQAHFGPPSGQLGKTTTNSAVNNQRKSS